MAHADDTERSPVFDSEGVRGTAAARALEQAGGYVLVTFAGGRRVQIPRQILRRRADGSHAVPFSLRELSGEAAVLPQGEEGGSEDSIVAVIPVVVEEAQVAKREVETGRVRIQKTVETTEEQVDVPLLRDTVQVERFSVERYLEEPAAPHYQGDTLVIPVMEEVLVVQKRLLLREEIHVTTVREKERHQETVTLQREQVTVTREEPQQSGVPAPTQATPADPGSSEYDLLNGG